MLIGYLIPFSKGMFFCLQFQALWLFLFQDESIPIDDMTSRPAVQIINSLESLIASTKEDLRFSASFDLESGWSDVLVGDFDDAFFARQAQIENMDRANGVLVVSQNSFRYDFELKSPLHATSVSEGRGETTLSTQYSSWANGVLLHYAPPQRAVSGKKLGGVLHISNVPHHEFFQLGRVAMAYCPFYLSGFQKGSWFGDAQKVAGVEFTERRVSYPGFDSPILKITAKSSVHPEFRCDWIFDDLNGFPSLLEINRGVSQVKFRNFIELKSGIKFPLSVVSADGPYLVDKNPVFSIKRFQIKNFSEDEPQQSIFDISILESDEVYGYRSNRVERVFNPFTVKRELIDSQDARLRLNNPIRVDNSIKVDGIYGGAEAGGENVNNWIFTVMMVVVAVICALGFLWTLRK